jgi:hypothetical protein
MHSLFYATAHLTKTRLHPVDPTNNLASVQSATLALQAKVCSVLLLAALLTSLAFWLLGSYA